MLWLIGGLLFSQLACDLSAPAAGDAPTSGEPAAADMVESTVVPTEKPKPTKAVESPGEFSPSASPGMACFGSAGNGITCLDENGWQVFTRDNSPLGGDYSQGMAVCPDDRLVVAHTSGISTFDGQSWKEYEPGWGHGSVKAVACDAAGDFWVAHYRGVSHFDGSGWTTYPADQLATGGAATDLVVDIATGPDGRVWAVTANSVALFRGDEWTVYQEGQGFDDRYFFDRIALDSYGRPWVAHGSGLLLFDDGTWTSYPNSNLYTVESLAVDAQGRLWVGTFSQGVSVFEGGGWLTYDSTSSELASSHVRVMTIDGRGRVWMGTEWGLYVVDGNDWRWFRMDNSDLGDHDIYALAVLGGGPSLPGAVEKPLGSIQGQIVHEDGEPIAGATVEICVEKLGSRFYGATPCSDQPFTSGAETDADGKFVIIDLPAGFYVVAVDAGDGWVQLTTDLGLVSERVLVEPGEETYLGELVVGAEE